MIVIAPNQQYGFESRGDWLNSIVFLNGIRQDCFYADDVAGIIKKFVFDEHKKDRMIAHSGEPTVDTLHGNVTIITRRGQ